MKWIVGYPIRENQPFLDEIIKNKEQISEVYFSWGDLPNGRSALSAEGDKTPFEQQMRQMEDLKRLSDAGLPLNLLYNANCYGKNSQSRTFFHQIGALTDFLMQTVGLATVTTSSPLIAKFIKENFESLPVRASVNMEIGTVEGISYLEDIFDSFYVKREVNRNRAGLQSLRTWCDAHGKQMYLLANSGCLNHCSAHTFHDNLVAHEAEIAAMDNGYDFQGICHTFLSKKKNHDTWLQRTNFIRPEETSLYEEFTPAMKLATRVNADPLRVLKAYLDGSYSGGTMDLLEPNHGKILFPYYFDNEKIDPSFAQHVLRCDKHCETCNFCKEVTRKACVNLGEDLSMKL